MPRFRAIGGPPPIVRAALCLALLAPATTSTAQDAARPELLVRVTDAYPAFSPDGSKIAYESNVDGDFDVYVVDLAAGTRAKLTDSPGRDGTPAWSPDGSRIAFMSDRDGNRQVYVMDADGTDPINLSDNQWSEEHPTWSPDGTRVLYVSDREAGEGSFDVWEMAADGAGKRRIAATPEVETYASWSADGTRIVCRRVLSEDDWAVLVMDADGSNDRVVAPAPGLDGWPVWTPDGRIVFSSDRSGSSFDLWIVDPDGGEPRRLTFDDERDDRQPWVSPDGAYVAFARYVWFRGEPFYEASEIHAVRLEER